MFERRPGVDVLALVYMNQRPVKILVKARTLTPWGEPALEFKLGVERGDGIMKVAKQHFRPLFPHDADVVVLFFCNAAGELVAGAAHYVIPVPVIARRQLGFGQGAKTVRTFHSKKPGEYSAYSVNAAGAGAALQAEVAAALTRRVNPPAAGVEPGPAEGRQPYLPP